jgi:hypothetical protein
MKMILDKAANSPEAAREQGAASRPPRSRAKKTAPLFAGKEFWRALTSASLPHAPTLRRLHD